MEEIHIALKHSVEDKLRPLDWLQTKWLKMIDDVAKMATEKGKGLERNDVGDISNMEAKQALIECGGEIDKAVEKCLEDRKAKVDLLSIPLLMLLLVLCDFLIEAMRK